MVSVFHKQKMLLLHLSAWRVLSHPVFPDPSTFLRGSDSRQSYESGEQRNSHWAQCSVSWRLQALLETIDKRRSENQNNAMRACAEHMCIMVISWSLTVIFVVFSTTAFTTRCKAVWDDTCLLPQYNHRLASQIQRGANHEDGLGNNICAPLFLSP